jgi:hypothetical protein
MAMCFLGEPFEHDLFVSYSHGAFAGVDHLPLKKWSEALAADLEAQIRQIRLFREADVFRDVNERPGHGVDPTEPLTDQLKEHIARSALLVILMSPDYVASGWCQKEREWWWERQMSDTFGAGGRVFVCRVMPNVKRLPWSQQQDAEDWPLELKDDQGHALTGFWFHGQNDVHFSTVPYRWDGQTNDINDYSTELRRLVRFITQRLSDIRQTLEEREREAQEKQKLAGSGQKIIYLHAREKDSQAWQLVHHALRESGYVVYPTAPEPNLPSGPIPDARAIWERRQNRVLQIADCDAMLLLCSRASIELDTDLLVIGHRDRQSARDLAGKPLPCAVLDQAGGSIPAARALAIDILDGRSPGWEIQVAGWLKKCGTILEPAA